MTEWQLLQDTLLCLPLHTSSSASHRGGVLRMPPKKDEKKNETTDDWLEVVATS